MTEDIQFLKDLQKELQTQDHDCQAAPRFWTVGDYHMVECAEGNQDSYQVSLPNKDYYGDLNAFLDGLKKEVQDMDEYSERAHTYAMSAWRAPKVERLLQILETFDWDKI